jgi:hypothetical protein
MIAREVEAVSDFLRHFGSFRCRQICVRRAEQLLREAAALIPRIGGPPHRGEPLAHQIPAIVPECARAIARGPSPACAQELTTCNV